MKRNFNYLMLFIIVFIFILFLIIINLLTNNNIENKTEKISKESSFSKEEQIKENALEKGVLEIEEYFKEPIDENGHVEIADNGDVWRVVYMDNDYYDYKKGGELYVDLSKKNLDVINIGVND